MNDTRTDAERRYDATRLSPLDQADTLIRAVLAPAATVDVEYLYYDERRALRKIASEIDELGNNSSMLPGMLEPEPATDEDYHATVEHAPYVLKRARKLAKQQRKRYRDFQP